MLPYCLFNSKETIVDAIIEYQADNVRLFNQSLVKAGIVPNSMRSSANLEKMLNAYSDFMHFLFVA